MKIPVFVVVEKKTGAYVVARGKTTGAGSNPILPFSFVVNVCMCVWHKDLQYLLASSGRFVSADVVHTMWTQKMSDMYVRVCIVYMHIVVQVRKKNCCGTLCIEHVSLLFDWGPTALFRVVIFAILLKEKMWLPGRNSNFYSHAMIARPPTTQRSGRKLEAKSLLFEKILDILLFAASLYRRRATSLLLHTNDRWMNLQPEFASHNTSWLIESFLWVSSLFQPPRRKPLPPIHCCSKQILYWYTLP